MFNRLVGRLFSGKKYHDHNQDPSYHSAQPHDDWASSLLSSSPCVVATTKDQGEPVVSVYVEIVECHNLASSAHDILAKVSNTAVCDPYVKVKCGEKAIHRTKFIPRANNPVFENIKHHSAFLIDGMPLEELQAAQGLAIKVKQHGNKEELGHVTLTCHQLLLSIHEDEKKLVLELLHPTTELPGGSGTITITCRPAQEYDVKYYKPRGYGYFKEYTPLALVRAPVDNNNTAAAAVVEEKPIDGDFYGAKPDLEPDSDASADGSHPSDPVKPTPTAGGGNSSSTMSRVSSLFRGMFGQDQQQQQPEHIVVKVNTMSAAMVRSDSPPMVVINPASGNDTVSSTVASLAESPHLKPHHPEDGPLNFVKRMSAKMMPNNNQRLEEEIEKERIQLFHPFDEAEKAIEQERLKIFHHEQTKNGASSSTGNNNPYRQGELEDAADRARDKCGACGDNCSSCVIL